MAAKLFQPFLLPPLPSFYTRNQRAVSPTHFTHTPENFFATLPHSLSPTLPSAANLSSRAQRGICSLQRHRLTSSPILGPSFAEQPAFSRPHSISQVQSGGRSFSSDIIKTREARTLSAGFSPSTRVLSVLHESSPLLRSNQVISRGMPAERGNHKKKSRLEKSDSFSILKNQPRNTRLYEAFSCA